MRSSACVAASQHDQEQDAYDHVYGVTDLFEHPLHWGRRSLRFGVARVVRRSVAGSGWVS